MGDGSQMSEARFKAIVDAYGANPAHWPASEREAAERLLGSSTAAKAVATEAAPLDRVLSTARQGSMSSDLEARIMADYERSARRRSPWRLLVSAAETVWPGAPLWQPACALGLALAIGVGVAAFVPLDVRQVDDSAASAFALDAPPDTDVGQDI